MLGMLTSLTKAVVAAAVETPVAVVADVVTMGGALTDRDEPYTAKALSNVVQNIEDAADPKRD